MDDRSATKIEYMKIHYLAISIVTNWLHSRSSIVLTAEYAAIQYKMYSYIRTMILLRKENFVVLPTVLGLDLER